jgi:small subunit ribosomal protein S9
MVFAKKDATTGQSLGTGRRKKAVARVRIAAGSGNIQINGRDLENYFPNVADQATVTQTLDAVEQRKSVDVSIVVTGGGQTGQSGACRMGLARALVSYNADLFQVLRDQGFLTRDSRMKERKKYGLRGARRGTQFSKR